MLENLLSELIDTSLMSITRQDAKGFLRSWSEAFRKKDKSFFYKIIPDDNVIFGIGTNKDELLTNDRELIKQIDRDFSEIDEAELNLEIMHFNSLKDVCWFSCLGKFIVVIDSNIIDFDTRVTMVLQRENGDIKLRQSHWSMPHPAGEEGKSFPTKDGIYQQLNDWIENFDLNPNFSEQYNRSKVKSYLIKAVKALQDQQESQ